MKNYLERTTTVNGHFKNYESYAVSPQHIHRSKQQHKMAVFILAKDIADTLSGSDEFSNTHKIGSRFAELAKKSTKMPVSTGLPSGLQPA